MNNRKRTRGRLIQVIKVPLTVKREAVDVEGKTRIVEIPNPGRNPGGTVQIKHVKL